MALFIGGTSAISVEDPARSFQLFLDGHKLLRALRDDVHKYRQIDIYRELFDRKFSTFSKANKLAFEQACKTVLVELMHAMPEIWPGSPPRTINRVVESLEGILRKINESKK